MYDQCLMDSILADGERIAKLETKLATSEELAEQHLREIDRQAERIAELEAENAELKRLWSDVVN